MFNSIKFLSELFYHVVWEQTSNYNRAILLTIFFCWLFDSFSKYFYKNVVLIKHYFKLYGPLYGLLCCVSLLFSDILWNLNRFLFRNRISIYYLCELISNFVAMVRGTQIPLVRMLYLSWENSNSKEINFCMWTLKFW